jgi:NADH dehydrogenase/NADH:ubiquinone oxidoreductase subunit G
MTGGRFVRVAETDRREMTIVVDGKPIRALEGDTLLVAILAALGYLRTSEFGDGRRAGFCLMGACQDCWVWSATGDRLRACSTSVVNGMAISMEQQEGAWGKFER